MEEVCKSARYAIFPYTCDCSKCIKEAFDRRPMTRRDHFAAAALVGFGRYFSPTDSEIKFVTKSAYQIADAMLAASENKI